MHTSAATIHSTPLSRRATLAGGMGAFALLAAGCGPRPSLLGGAERGLHSFTGMSMGSSYTVKIAAQRLSQAGLAASRQAVAAALGGVVAQMSHYERASEVSRLNRQPLGRAMAVSAATLQVFEAAAAVQQASGGAFDVSLGDAVDAWGFGPSQNPPQLQPARRAPPLSEQARLQAVARSSALVADAKAGTLVRLAPVQADLSGIAKGYGVDLAAEALQALGFGDFMVEVGGEIRTLGTNARGQPWQLAIERPDAMPQQAFIIVPMSGRSLATSGDYRNFFMQDGRRYTHEIDPATAAPVEHALASVSVVASDCTMADAWSTALFVLGPERGPQTATRLGLAACFLQRRTGGSFSIRSTPAFAALGARDVG